VSCLARLALAPFAWAERNAILICVGPAKIATQNQSAPAKHANARFWDALHAGRYDDLPDVIEELTAAYLQDPRDPETTAHIGFAHAWFGAERARLERKPATLTEHVLIARRYFAEAVRLSPKDERFKG